MSTYTIVIKNQSDKTRYYFVIPNAPQVEPSPDKVWSNIIARSDAVDSPDGFWKVDINTTYYAVAAETHGGPAEGVSVNVSSAVPVTLAGPGVHGTVLTSTVEGGGISFRPEVRGETKKAKSFGINMEQFDDAEHQFVTIGTGGKIQNAIVPAAAFRPSSLVSYAITPSLIYYVGIGDYRPGQLIDVTTSGRKGWTKIDFADAPPGLTVANITERSDGSWSDIIFSRPVR